MALTQIESGMLKDSAVTTAKINDGALSADAAGRAKMADSFITYLKLASAAGTALARRNVIINGDFNIWQRSASITGITNDAFFADRWQYAKSGTMVHDIARSDDVPSVAQAGRLFRYPLLIDCTTADAAIAAGDYCAITQKIEGFNFAPLAQRSFTCSFWVKATKTGTYCVSFVNSGSDRSYVAEYAINTTDTWEFKTINVTASPAAGTWDYINGIGLRVYFSLAAGSTVQTTAGAWQTGNFLATSNQVNGTDNAANNFRITGLQVEAGDSATPFEQRSIQEEFELCQRYWQQSYAEGTAAGTSTTTGAVTGVSPVDTGSTAHYVWMAFPTRMRAAPTTTVYSTTGASARWRDLSDGADVVAAGGSAAPHGFVSQTGGGGLTANQTFGFHFTASAEL